MKFFGFVLAVVLAAGSSASAQVASPPLLMPNAAVPTASAATSRGATEPAAHASPQRIPLGVYENFRFQGYVGFTFLRFYEVPHMIQSRSGFDSSLAYFFNSRWFGLDGALVGGFGSQSGYRSRFLFGGGGPRLRWSGQRALEYWGHALVGGSHYTPQTAFGSQSALAYELGGGVDATAHHRRLAYRLELDVIGTRYFGTYQYSPKASVGLVYRF